MEQTLNGHTGGVYSVAFNDDGTKVVSGSWDKTIKVWNVATGEMEGTVFTYDGKACPRVNPRMTCVAVAAGNKVHIFRRKG
jgi:WD40 repeat protein